MGWYLLYQINWHEYYKIIIKHNSSILTNFITAYICIHTHSHMHTNINVIQTNVWESRDLNFKFTFSNSLYALWSTVPLQSFRNRKETGARTGKSFMDDTASKLDFDKIWQVKSKCKEQTDERQSSEQLVQMHKGDS